jgi:protein-tyrosine-phosphatase
LCENSAVIFNPLFMSQPDHPKSVLFVCTGNTCRSPMAEGLLKAALKDGQYIQVESAGVAAMPGQGASRETQNVLKKKKAPLENFKSRQVDQGVLDRASLVVAMTQSHADLVRRFFPESAGDVKLLCDFIDPDEGLAGVDVPDPIGMGRAAYEEVAEVIELAIPGIMAELAEDKI